jgi:hypothetical protein
MNNKERLIWVSVVIIFAFFCENKLSQVENLEFLNEHNRLNSQIQRDQINELSSIMNQSDSVSYEKGFREGESHAMVTAINGDNLKDYKDGYHAAIDQFQFDKGSDEIYELFIEVLEASVDSNQDYEDLLQVIANGKTN